LGTTCTLTAQEVVHALTGTVTAISLTSKIIVVKTDDGSDGLFKVLTNANASLDFANRIRAGAIAADAFRKTGTQVLVYYFGTGENDLRTAVALEDLGVSPLVKVRGTVVKLDRHEHLLTIRNPAGVATTFHIDDKTVAETALGVVEGEKCDAQKGDQVRVTATPANGVQTALFIRER
jgi:hypothetical protein